MTNGPVTIYLLISYKTHSESVLGIHFSSILFGLTSQLKGTPIQIVQVINRAFLQIHEKYERT